MKVAITVDGNAGFTIKEAEDYGVVIIPTPVIIDGEIYIQEVSLSEDTFYSKLASGATISTSQPSPASLTECWDKLLTEYDEIVYIPISSGLAAAYATAHQISITEERYKGKVFVVDNQRVSLSQKISVIDAANMAKAGKSAQEIAAWLKETALKASIYLMVDDLKHLKRSGRLTAAAAAIGTLLKIKPVLQIQGFKIDQYAKVRKFSEAKLTMINALKNDVETRFKEDYDTGRMVLGIAHTQNVEEALKFKDEIEAEFPKLEVRLFDPLPLSVVCHTGPGALGCGCSVTLTK